MKRFLRSFITAAVVAGTVFIAVHRLMAPHIPPYVGPSGWIGVRLEGKASWAMIEEILFEGYRSVAPKRALKLLDAE